MNIDTTGNWKLYWGAMPLPTGAEAIGVIERSTGDRGALLLLSSGIYAQGNAGGARSLDQNKIKKELGLPIHGGKREGAGAKSKKPEGSRTEQLKVACTPLEKKQIRAAATSVGMSVNEYLISRAIADESKN